MLLLRAGAPFVATFVLTMTIYIGWHLVLHEWPETVSTMVLTFSIGVIVGYNWPAKWRAW